MKEKKQKPPKIAEWLLRKILPDYTGETAPGDFEEGYRNIYNTHGQLKASHWYWVQIIKSIPLLFINSLYWRVAMLKNYIKILIRNIKKNKIYSLINIIGLATGMACCIIVMLFVQDELSYDKFHENSNRIYRIITKLDLPSGSKLHTKTWSEITKNLRSEFPEVSDVARIIREFPVVILLSFFPLLE